MSLPNFQPPAFPPTVGLDLASRVRVLIDHYTLKFIPYLFTYLPERAILDSIRFNAPLTPAPDGVTQQFTLTAGSIRLAPDGSPQATLQLGTTPLQYTTSPTPAPGKWTLVVTAPTLTAPPMQTIRTGDVPGVGQYFVCPVAVLA